MEDNGEPMYSKSKTRQEEVFGYNYLKLDNDGSKIVWFGSHHANNKIYSPQEVIDLLNNNQTYEIY